TLKGDERNAANPLKDVAVGSASRYSPDDIGNSVPRLVCERSQTISSRDGSAYGNGRNNTPFTTVNTAVVAPIPSASVASAASVNTGFFRSVRIANEMSCVKAWNR